MNLQIFKVAFRNSFKSKSSSFINIFGLSVGLGIILILIFIIRHELSYNRFHDKTDNIYCVLTKDQHSKGNMGWNESVPILPKVMMEEMPEVLQATLVENCEHNLLCTIGDNVFYEDIQFARSNLFKIFSFPIIRGEIPDENRPSNIIALSQTSAAKYFSNSNPIGQHIKINNEYDFEVVAIFKDIPSNSSLRFDFWAPVEFLPTLYNESDEYIETWYNLSFQAYVLLKDGASVDEVNKKLEGRIIKSNPSSKAEAQLYPFSDLYLKLWGRLSRIRMLIFIATIIVSLVTINFVNLKTASSFQRIKEFGIRSVNGASKGYIIKQLLGETTLSTLLSACIAIVLAQLSFPLLGNLVGISEASVTLFSFLPLLIILTIALLIAIVAALISYTILLSSLANSLKQKISENTGVVQLRKILVGVQFALAIGLVICTLVITGQVNFLRNKDLGYDKEQLLYINLEGKLQTEYSTLKDELQKHPGITNTTVTSRIPTGIFWNGDGWDWDGKPEYVDPMITFTETDKDFAKTMGLNIVDGDYFVSSKQGVVINQTFANIISPNGNALQTILRYAPYGVEAEVTGIINDFHFKPLNREIGPLMLINELGFDNMKYMFIKVSPYKLIETLAYIEKTVKTLNPDFGYRYRFLDDDFAQMYRDETRLRNQLTFFSVLAIVISCLGLWGILLFVVQRRAKEIGIRKVNGARIIEILSMLNMDFIKWVLIAFVIACPIAYYMMSIWLDNFAYKTTISWWIFALAGTLAMGVALVTISWQSWRAASRNPVEALRYE